MNYLKPDGGKRILAVEVEITDPDHTGYGNETTVTMTEDLGHDRKTQVFHTKFRER